MQLRQKDEFEQVMHGDMQLLQTLVFELAKVPWGQEVEFTQVLLNRYELLLHEVQFKASMLHVAHELLQLTQIIIPDWLKTYVPVGQRPRHWVPFKK